MISTELPASPSGRVTRLTVEGFRGFRDRALFDLDASAVLITGPNGTGKTSVFDALLWVFVGDVPRLARFKLRKNDEYLRNEYVGGSRPARAEVEFNIAGQSVTARRSGTSSSSLLTLVVGGATYSGQDAEQRLEGLLARGQLPLAEVMATSGLLQQDDLRLLLRIKPDERYRQLLRLLGLESIERFARHASSDLRAKRAASRDVRALAERSRNETKRVGEQLETVRLQVEAVDNAQQAAPEGIETTLASYSDLLRLEAEPATSEGFSAIAGSTRNLAEQVRRLHDQLDALPDSLPPGSPEELAKSTTSLATLREDAERLRDTQRQADEALRLSTATQDALNRLAAAALPLLGNDESGHCPLCGSTISPRHVAEELSARAASGAAQAAAEAFAAAIAEDVRRVDAAIEDLSRTEARLRAEAAERRGAVTTLRGLLTSVVDLQRQGAGSGIGLIEVAPMREVITAADSLERNSAAEERSDAFFQLWVSSREGILSYLSNLVDALRSLAGAADTASAARLAARAAAERSAAVPRLQARWDEQRGRLEQAEREYEEARRAETAAAALAESTTSAAAELFRERFAALEPLVNDIYARLDPHPSFTKLDFRVETYRARGTAVATVMDVVENITANPMIVFSSAQANAVVLSAFLALGWASGDRGLPFVLLDDPLQALDDVNVLGFADLARQLRRQRQLVLATHEDRFADLLERKLTGRTDGEDLIIHQFLGWSRSGPTVQTRRVGPRSDLQLRVLAAG